MNIKRWTPRNHKIKAHCYAEDGKGGTGHEAMIYTEWSAVEVFTYDGRANAMRPVTTLSTYYMGEFFECRLPRVYHPRWIPRLARDFMWQIVSANAVPTRVVVKGSGSAA